MNNQKNPIIKTIIKLCLYFYLVMIITSIFIFIFASFYYNTLMKSTTIETTKQETTTEEIIPEEEKAIVSTTNDDILILVEKNRNYKIYVDIETRNMYITPNVYPNESYTLMYDGEVPKIYTEDLNGQSYQDFLKNK